jgi:hypothetical protein
MNTITELSREFAEQKSERDQIKLDSFRAMATGEMLSNGLRQQKTV